MNDIPQTVLDAYQRIKDRYPEPFYEVGGLATYRDVFVCFTAQTGADVTLPAYVIDRQGNVEEIPALSDEWFTLLKEVPDDEE